MAALSRTSPIAPEIGLLAELLAQNTTETGLTLPADRAEWLLNRLDLLKRQIANLETELGAFRVGETGKAVSAVLNDLSLEVMQDGVLDAAANEPRIVYPQFGKGGSSNGQR